MYHHDIKYVFFLIKRVNIFKEEFAFKPTTDFERYTD